MSLLESNRHPRDVKPKKTAKLSDLENTQETKPKKKWYKTSLNIKSTTRNKLQAMVLLDDAPNQKEGIDIAMQMYYDNLDPDKKQMFDMFYKSLQRKDVNKRESKS